MEEETITFFIGIIVVVLLLVGGFKAYQMYYPKDKGVIIEEQLVNEINLETSKDLVKLDNEKEGEVFIGNERDYLENPRIKIRNSSGDEVIGLDHNGTIAAINIESDNNLTTTNITASDTGFFSRIRGVIVGWFQDIHVSGTTNSTYVNASEAIYESGERVALNSTLSNYYSTSNPDGYIKVDTSATVNCSDGQVLLGNGTCWDSSVFFDDTDTVGVGNYDNIALINQTNNFALIQNFSNLSVGGCSEVWNGTCNVKTCPTTIFVQC